MSSKLSNLRTIKRLTTENPDFTEGGLRAQIFNADNNGLAESGAIIRNGRRVLIDTDKYYQWLMQSQTGKF